MFSALRLPYRAVLRRHLAISLELVDPLAGGAQDLGVVDMTHIFKLLVS